MSQSRIRGKPHPCVRCRDLVLSIVPAVVSPFERDIPNSISWLLLFNVVLLFSICSDCSGKDNLKWLLASRSIAIKLVSSVGTPLSGQLYQK